MFNLIKMIFVFALVFAFFTVIFYVITNPIGALFTTKYIGIPIAVSTILKILLTFIELVLFWLFIFYIATRPIGALFIFNFKFPVILSLILAASMLYFLEVK